MKSVVVVAVISALLAGGVHAATTAASEVILNDGGTVELAISQQAGQISGLGSDVSSLYATSTAQTAAINAAQASANTANNNNTVQDASINKNASDITNLTNTTIDTNTFQTSQLAQANKDTSQDLQIGNNVSRITALENAPTPANGVDGKDGIQGLQGIAGADGKNGIDGKDGMSTTLIKSEVDIATKAKVEANTTKMDAVDSRLTVAEIQAKAQADKQQEIANTVSLAQSSVTATKQHIADLESNTNKRFASLKSEIDDNKKESRSGAASAIAIASMP